MVNLMKVKMNIPKIVIWIQGAASTLLYSLQAPDNTLLSILANWNHQRVLVQPYQALRLDISGAGGQKNISVSSWFIV